MTERPSFANAPPWVKGFGLVALVLFVVVVFMHLTGHPLGGHLPSSPRHAHESGASGP